jgi:alpha-D-ribose 1-methylphosphonate 5-triphosphate synthase subunit PhnH
MNQNALSAGLGDPVHEAQAAFRGVLEALSRPGQRMTIGRPVTGLALGPAMAHLLLALTDDDTPVWWQQPGSQAADWLRFHTGARLAAAPGDAAFGVIDDVVAMPALDAFAAGSAQSPEHAATLLIEVPSLSEGPAVEWHGPGIRDKQTVRLAGLPAGFWTLWQANHAAFPQGVDIVFTCADGVLGLPRTTRVRRLEGI